MRSFRLRRERVDICPKPSYFRTPISDFTGQLAILFIAILVGNVLRTWVPFQAVHTRRHHWRVSGLILKQIPALTPLVDNATMEIITYHCLGLGFAAMALKTAQEEKKVSTVKVVESGAIMAGGYLIQALVGLVISIAFFYAAGKFYAAGLILPMGFGQSTGSALSWGSNFEANYGFAGGLQLRPRRRGHRLHRRQHLRRHLSEHCDAQGAW